jgi:hypothetical protein
MSLRARLLAASLALVVLGLVVADVATYRALRSFLYARVDDQLEAAHGSLVRAVVDPRARRRPRPPSSNWARWRPVSTCRSATVPTTWW